MHLESISNGLGAQSMLLLLMATRGEIPATTSITADTGWEQDRLWSTGARSTARVYFDTVVVPLARSGGIDARFVRSRYKIGSELETLEVHVEQCAATGKHPNIPMFGSKGGRLRQVCTDKWKIRALRQEARRVGASTNRNAQGIHYGESSRRVRGLFLGDGDGWSTYQTTVIRAGVEIPVRWQTHYYPLVDLRIGREQAQQKLASAGIPYLLSSECDGCPHKDLSRWRRTSPAVVDRLAALEERFNGKLFFTSLRVPLRDALVRMEQSEEPSFGCQTSICGI